MGSARVSSWWLAGLLSVVLAGLSGYAVFGSWRQAGIVSALADDSADTDAYQDTAYLMSWELALDTGVLAGVEALARWTHPTKGPISPGEFIPVLEATTLIHRFTRQVLTQALAQARAWLDEGHRTPVAVNLSTRSLLDTTFPERLAALLRQAGVPGELLAIEVTEYSVMSDPATAIATLKRIRQLGVKTSIDDYGTGYSSMTHLRLPPLDELKIDRSFVKDLAADRSSRALVASTVELGHTLGLTVVAEGIEDEPTLTALREIGCDLAQGYFLARPMPADALTRTLRPQAVPAA